MDDDLKNKLKLFPRTRYMGSKQKLTSFIYDNVKDLHFDTALDAFSGSGSVSFLFKVMGKEVHTNDFLKYSYFMTKALIENNNITLTTDDINSLLYKNHNNQRFISTNFKGLYFTDEENIFIDNTYANIKKINNQYKQALALAALARACVKKRARGIFTFTGMRYDDGRPDLQISIENHFVEAIKQFNKAVFDNQQNNKSFNQEVFALEKTDYDLVYIDPPYVTQSSDNDYSRRYHFVEGLMSYWSHVKINYNTSTKKFDKIKTPFESKSSIYMAFDNLFKKFNNSILVVSYSSTSIPTMEEMIKIMKKYKKNVSILGLTHRYSFGNQKKGLKNNVVKEYLFIGTD